jgi:hypothetical protein
MTKKQFWDFIGNNDVVNLMKNNDKGFSYKKASGIFLMWALYKLHDKVDSSTVIMMAGLYVGLIGAIIGINTFQQVVNKKEDNKNPTNGAEKG